MSIHKLCEKYGIPVYGDPCSSCTIKESVHMVTFFNQIRGNFPSFGRVATHIRNEGKRHYSQTYKQKSEGMVRGASDIIIPGSPSFVCEMKSRSVSAKISIDQLEYLAASMKIGAFACVALGWEAAMQAFEEWRQQQ